MCARIWPLCMPVYSYCGGEKRDQFPGTGIPDGLRDTMWVPGI